MRSWLTGCLVVFAVAGWTASGSAQALDAVKVVTVTVSPDGFSPNDLTIRKGWTVRWESTSGTFNILSGTPEDPAEDQGKLFKIALSGEDAKVEQVISLDLGSYEFFIQGMPALRGTLTVLESTPISPTTWGFLKKMFEN